MPASPQTFWSTYSMPREICSAAAIRCALPLMHRSSRTFATGEFYPPRRFAPAGSPLGHENQFRPPSRNGRCRLVKRPSPRWAARRKTRRFRPFAAAPGKGSDRPQSRPTREAYHRHVAPGAGWLKPISYPGEALAICQRSILPSIPFPRQCQAEGRTRP